MITLAVDAMGGDNAPDAIVEGCVQALRQPDLKLVLVGQAAVLHRLLQKHPHDGQRLQVVHAPEAIGMDEKPQEAVERHPQSSMRMTAELVATGKADGLVSAGNTGALLLTLARTLPRIQGIRRTALAAVYPTERRHGPYGDPFALMLDVGATLDASAEDLVRFAIMGHTYARVISRNPRPRIALLSNGEEAMKGSAEIVQAHKLLLKMPELNFMGNVEGLDIPRGTADVIVCNGFVGNIVIKMLEGVSEVVGELALYAMERSLIWKTGMLLLSRGIKRVLELTDWEAYGGAPILGFQHVVIKAHGRSGPRALRNAIKVAAKAVRGRVPDEIRRGVAWMEPRLSALSSENTGQTPTSGSDPGR